jgi:hypothetical protein
MRQLGIGFHQRRICEPFADSLDAGHRIKVKRLTLIGRLVTGNVAGDGHSAVVSDGQRQHQPRILSPSDKIAFAVGTHGDAISSRRAAQQSSGHWH